MATRLRPDETAQQAATATVVERDTAACNAAASSPDGHHPTAAATCHVHVSTLKYRLSVIRRVLGRSLSDPDVKFGLRVAFRLMDILQPRLKGEATRDRRAGAGHPPPAVTGS